MRKERERERERREGEEEEQVNNGRTATGSVTVRYDTVR